jgi:hypothetical protein
MLASIGNEFASHRLCMNRGDRKIAATCSGSLQANTPWRGAAEPRVARDTADQMRKATLIAKCFVIAGLSPRPEGAEGLVRGLFAKDFPRADFTSWNTEIDDSVARQVIEAIARSGKRFDPRDLMHSLWEE